MHEQSEKTDKPKRQVSINENALIFNAPMQRKVTQASKKPSPDQSSRKPDKLSKEADEISSATSFTESDFDDADAQRIQYGEQADIVLPAKLSSSSQESSPSNKKVIRQQKFKELPTKPFSNTIQEQSMESYLESELQSTNSKVPTITVQTMSLRSGLTLRDRAKSLVREIKDHFDSQIKRFKSIFRKPQPEDN